MLTDYHSHILPGIDDGARDAEMSVAMLEMLEKQGVERIAATPHFYAHREKSVERFLEKRKIAFEKIKDKSGLKILLGAEVAVEHDISEVGGIEKLAIGDSGMLLLELPHRPFEEWICEEIYHISATYGLRVILAHIHRYTAFYTKEQMEKILGLNVIFQINHEAFETHSGRSMVKKLVKAEKQLVIGSDCHNISDRVPNWGLVKRKCKPEIIRKSNDMM